MSGLQLIRELGAAPVGAVRTTDGYGPATAMWLRMSNVHPSFEETLAGLPPQRVLWKLEHMGASAGRPFLAESLAEVLTVANALRDAGHRTVAYTFTAQAAHQMQRDLPELSRFPLAIIPLAQKVLLDAAAPRSDGVVRIGAGGSAHAGKGLAEIVRWFEALDLQPHQAILSLAVIPRDAGPATGQGAEDVAAELGIARDSLARGTVELSVGEYDQWPQMCRFYRSLDAMVINSRADSWGRMLSEAISWEVPVLVRRAECGANYAWDGLTTFDQLEDVTWMRFTDLVERARRAAAGLAHQACARYSLDVVIDRTIDVLLEHTEPPARHTVTRLAQHQQSRHQLGSLLIF